MQRSIQGLRRHWWLVPALAVLVGVLRWAGAASRPVRVCDLSGNLLTVQDGRVVLSANDRNKGSELIVQPARGGFSHKIQLPRGHDARAAQITATHLIYLTAADRNTPPASAVAKNPASNIRAYELHRVPWNGGSPEVVRFEGEEGARLTREGCFWWGESSSSGRPLRYVPLEAGDARTIREAPTTIGGGGGMMLATSSGGVITLVPTGVTVPPQKVSLQTQGDGPQVRIEPWPLGSKRVELGERVERGESVFWVEHDLITRRGAEPHPDKIMSARLDGSDRQVVIQAQDRSVEFGQLLAHRNSLYVTLIEVRRENTPDGRPMRVASLCRIRPDDTAEPRRICPLPEGQVNCHFDGDDVYFAVPENREKWWDWSSGGLIPRRVTAWYHFRLPAE